MSNPSILNKSFVTHNHYHMVLTSSIPTWVTSQQIEKTLSQLNSLEGIHAEVEEKVIKSSIFSNKSFVIDSREDLHHDEILAIGTLIGQMCARK